MIITARPLFPQGTDADCYRIQKMAQYLLCHRQVIRPFKNMEIEMKAQMQKGFTLIELMIVVAIIGILAAIALPAYQDYTTRAKVTEAMAAASACKTGVAEFIQTTGAFPTDADQAGCNAESKYVEKVEVEDLGLINVFIQGTSVADLDGQLLQLQPTTDADRTTAMADGGDAVMGWSCGTDAASTEYKYFPASCRQAILGGL